MEWDRNCNCPKSDGSTITTCPWPCVEEKLSALLEQHTHLDFGKARTLVRTISFVLRGDHKTKSLVDIDKLFGGLKQLEIKIGMVTTLAWDRVETDLAPLGFLSRVDTVVCCGDKSENMNLQRMEGIREVCEQMEVDLGRVAFVCQSVDSIKNGVEAGCYPI